MTADLIPAVDADKHDLWLDHRGHVQYVGLRTGPEDNPLVPTPGPGWRRLHVQPAEAPVPCVLDDHGACHQPEPNDAARAELIRGAAELLEEIAPWNKGAEITEGKTLREELDIDSLSMVELIVAAEERFHVRIADELTQTFITVGDLVNHIDKLQHASL